MSHLSPSAIFSPTLARQHLAAAKDWTYIDSWLSTHFPTGIPPFERTPDTLRAILALAALNESADEEAELLAQIESNELSALRSSSSSFSSSSSSSSSSSPPPHSTPVLHALEANLTREGRTALDVLADTAVALHLPSGSIEAAARKILEVQRTVFDAEQARERVNILHVNLEAELVGARRLQDELRGEAYQAEQGLAEETVDFQRRTKVIVARIPELRERATALRAAGGEPKPTIGEIAQDEERYNVQFAVVKDLEAQVRSYHGLPHDTDLARLELEALRVELKELKAQRDGMFEGLVERESPAKYRSR